MRKQNRLLESKFEDRLQLKKQNKQGIKPMRGITPVRGTTYHDFYMISKKH